MSLPGDSLDLLARRAETAGFEPWLFVQEGHDWRWWSWSEAQAAVGRIAGSLERLRLGSGFSVALPEPLSPATVVAALAVLGVGAVPVVGEAEEGVHLVAEGAARAASFRFQLELVPSRIASGSAARPECGGRVVLALSPELAAAAEEAAAAPARPVLVRGPLSGVPANLTGIAWSIASGSGLVLESLPAALAATILWARPTHLAEPGPRLTELAGRLAQLAGGRDPAPRLARRLARLRRVWWLGEPPSEPAIALFERVGAKVAEWPQTALARSPSTRS